MSTVPPLRPDRYDPDRDDRPRLRPEHGAETDAYPAFRTGTFDDWREPAFEPQDEPEDEPRRLFPWWRWIVRGTAAGVVLLVVAIVWLAFTAPLSRSLKPPTPPSITLTAADNTPIARRGAIIGAPVDAARLPAHVREAFLAIEDRRFYTHWGIDPRGILRAAWANVGSGGVRQGGSTITQQLAKNAFLDSDRTAARKIREVMIAFWLEAWLTKDEILSRYLSNVYFGDNVYGITAAAKHYFGRTPDRLNVGQAAMLAGLVKAPSRLAPTVNLKGARAREMVVVAAMRDAGFLTPVEAAAVQPQRVLPKQAGTLPAGTYFADWVLPAAREAAGEVSSESTVTTTLDRRLQRAAEQAVRSAGLRQAQAALVAMHPDGRVVAMVGGRDYAKSPFNRATQAKRQPGSSFKLFVYLAALRAGMTPESTVDDSPVDIAGWKPKNDDGRYLGRISLARAFARSSNVAAARLTQEVGVRNVVKAARDLGISTPIANEATISLGTSEVTLLELTAAYAAIAEGRYPVSPRGVDKTGEKSWYQQLTSGQKAIPADVRANMLRLLGSSIRGTGREAVLSVDAWGKTGTSQQERDGWFIGFAGDLVVGVWVGNDDSSPNPGLHGGGVPARIWRAFMQSALDIAPVAVAAPEEVIDGNTLDDLGNQIDDIGADAIGAAQDRLQDFGIDLRQNEDGSIVVGPRRDVGRDRDAEPPPEDRRNEDRGDPDEGPPDEGF